ncbi:PGRS family protein [Frankia tisae]|uniref:PGRS family protein n=1 Tax=Frankia tisae TaxID=2950104 RepID=UPI0021C01756|nr:PGRS family protein [Frankia tisae]
MAAVPLAFVVVLAGCGGGDAVSAPVTGAAAAPGTHAGALTAGQVAIALGREGAPLTSVTVYTAESDPKKLLGRPGGYTSKATFSDTRISPAGLDEGSAPDAVDRGGVVEVFPTAEGATARAKFIQATLQGAQGVLGSEYDYTAGPVLVRVTGTLTPAQAAVYERATAGATR